MNRRSFMAVAAAVLAVSFAPFTPRAAAEPAYSPWGRVRWNDPRIRDARAKGNRVVCTVDGVDVTNDCQEADDREGWAWCLAGHVRHDGVRVRRPLYNHLGRRIGTLKAIRRGVVRFSIVPDPEHVTYRYVDDPKVMALSKAGFDHLRLPNNTTVDIRHLR